MTDAPLTPEDDDDALAGEYVLGVLDMADRSAVEARMKADAVFAARVTAWERRLSPLDDETPEAAAPDLMPQIEARIFGKERRPRHWLAWISLGLSGAIAAGLIFAVVFMVPPTPQVVAVLATKDAGLSYRLTQVGEQLTVTRVAGTPAPAGQVHQLWIIAPGASPVSLGLLGDEALVVDYPKPPAGWMFAVSVEPEGGSPSGLPTGPVILAAPVTSDT
ncbi:anti-sigma factor [Tabrizicola sp. BL-A-41-H6]|uniref:anti-sigma factor n=1 Tax=Tabrizicola sp. BL-A-41-H6 TaxID=3421107 RepID=UPI003D66FC89